MRKKKKVLLKVTWDFKNVKQSWIVKLNHFYKQQHSEHDVTQKTLFIFVRYRVYVWNYILKNNTACWWENRTKQNKTSTRLCTNLLNPATEMKPLLPVQDRLSHWTRMHRACRNSKELSFTFAQYGCRLRWMYCRGSQQCWFSSLQVCANLHRSGSVRWFRISWMSYMKQRNQNH